MLADFQDILLVLIDLHLELFEYRAGEGHIDLSSALSEDQACLYCVLVAAEEDI